jgi:hypothetical protein
MGKWFCRRSWGAIGEHVVEVGLDWALMLGVLIDRYECIDITIRIGPVYIWLHGLL